ncbi:hypothetical protein [Streptosporangium sp. NPDC087985]|uniref:hypothetical protein n=1 Tax=Streptosporangium sp. NPDC087985 TaxID=3366196 RepID=UPI0037F40E53
MSKTYQNKTKSTWAVRFHRKKRTEQLAWLSRATARRQSPGTLWLTSSPPGMDSFVAQKTDETSGQA